jgi:rod shape-determining protein MreD
MAAPSLNPRARRDQYGSRINRDHSPILANIVPWGTILLASLAPFLPLITSAPVLPPLGLLFLVAWRLASPGLLPLWAGAPLGAFDDMFSGQPFGSGVLLWSLAMIAIETVETRFPWRTFWQDWLTATAVVAVYLVAASLLAGIEPGLMQLRLILPQLLLSIVLFPIVARVVASFDRLRLLRVRTID